MNLYDIVTPTGKQVPILISSPHSGTYFPKEIKQNYHPELISRPDDTDWFINKLYDFAPSMGITLLSANYSRWVIDLNRDPMSQPLYTDGRIITSLCPTQSFRGENLYFHGMEPDQKEIQRRLNTYYWPYYQKIESILNDLKTTFGQVLFWDAHSIRSYLPLIRKEKFPSMILGDNDGKSASSAFSETAKTVLSEGGILNYNDPFKGGHLTRYFGKPALNQHALQLEMTKKNYMDNNEQTYDFERAAQTRLTLQEVFTKLIQLMSK